VQLLFPDRREPVHVPGGAGRRPVPVRGDRLLLLQGPQRAVHGGRVVIDPELRQAGHEVVSVAGLFFQQQQEAGMQEALRESADGTPLPSGYGVVGIHPRPPA
jgi:hypothetical protein